MSELDKLEEYLKEHGAEYTRYDEDREFGNVHQIVVFSRTGRRKWDAICQTGSYGYAEGLLEIMGSLVKPKLDGDTVVGFLTAEDVIRRLENDG